MDFDKIYELFLDTEVNSQSLADMDSYSLSKYLKSLIFMARSELYASIYSNKDAKIPIMEDITEFETFNFYFKYSNSPLFILEPIVPQGYNLQIILNNVELDYGMEYTYDWNTGELEILKPLFFGDKISVTAFKNPIFNQELNIMEIGLLVVWMGVVFLRDKLKDQKVYNFTVFGKEDKVYAQSNFMKELKDSLKEAETLAKQKTVEYTYKLHPEHLRPMVVKGQPSILGDWRRRRF